MVSTDVENERFRTDLRQLRETIIDVDPTVMYDGRFEEMFASPVTTINIARQLIETIPRLRS